MLKIRWPLGRLIFNMGIAIPGKTVFLIETAPRHWQLISLNFCAEICENESLTDRKIDGRAEKAILIYFPTPLISDKIIPAFHAIWWYMLMTVPYKLAGQRYTWLFRSATWIYLWRSRTNLKIKMLYYQYRNFHYKDKRSCNSIFFIMQFTIPGKTVFILRQGPGLLGFDPVVSLYPLNVILLHISSHLKLLLHYLKGGSNWSRYKAKIPHRKCWGYRDYDM